MGLGRRAHIIFHRSKISLIILSLALAGQIAVNATSMGRQLKWSVYREGYCNINPRKWTRQSVSSSLIEHWIGQRHLF